MPAFAQVNGIKVPGGGDKTFEDLIGGFIKLLLSALIPVCVAVFLFGALTYIFSAIHEESRSKGKSIMIGALIGVALGVGTEAILNFILFVISQL